MRIVGCVLALAVFGPPIVITRFIEAAAQLPTAPAEGSPVTLPRASQDDVRSQINGQTYRVMVSTPYMADPGFTYPALYVLDGNVYFGTAAETMTRQAVLRTAAPAIVIGIGYPTDDPQEAIRRRQVNQTPSVSKAPNFQGLSGGGDLFLRVLEEELKPFVAERYPLDRRRQIIWGHSLGGLIVLRALFRNPESFSTFILSSPSIWWNDREVLADEEAFSKRARAGAFRLRVLVTSAADEQYRGDDPKLRASDSRMVDNASELAARLKLLRPADIVVERVIFDGEVHNSVQQASLSRTMRFAFPRP